MENFWIGGISQIGIYAIFLILLVVSFRKGGGRWLVLVSGVIFALLFEHVNVVRYANLKGGYHYHPDSWFWLAGDVPLYIPLAWGCLLLSSLTLTDRLNLKPWARPFCDACLALLIDFSLDIVAIRFHFWTWQGVRFDEGFFGVPADNFFGWLLVSFAFSVLTRWLESLKLLQFPDFESPKISTRRKSLTIFAYCAAIPLLAQAFYLALEKIVILSYWLFHAATLNDQLKVLWGTLILFLATIICCGKMKSPRTNHLASVHEPTSYLALMHYSRHAFHLFGVAGLFYLTATGVTRDPSLWLVTGVVWGVECLVFLAIYLESNHKNRHEMQDPEGEEIEMRVESQLENNKNVAL